MLGLCVILRKVPVVEILYAPVELIRSLRFHFKLKFVMLISIHDSNCSLCFSYNSSFCYDSTR
jgi:hypothetical protein